MQQSHVCTYLQNNTHAARSFLDDINSTPGFLRALTYVLHLGPQGLLWAAPPCSTWVWIGRSQTGRTRRDPLGDKSKTFVDKANQQVSRVVLLILVAMLLHNAVWIAEQPASSIMELHRRVDGLSSMLGDWFRKLFLWLQPHGGTSPKATLLYCCFWLKEPLGLTYRGVTPS